MHTLSAHLQHTTRTLLAALYYPYLVDYPHKRLLCPTHMHALYTDPIVQDIYTHGIVYYAGTTTDAYTGILALSYASSPMLCTICLDTDRRPIRMRICSSSMRIE